MSELDYIRTEALSIEEGSTTTVYCPFCDNEKPYAPSLSLTRNEDGLVYNCYRAVCSGRGFIGSMPYERLDKAPVKPTTNPFTGETKGLTSQVYDALWNNYRIRPQEAAPFRLSGGRLIMPMVRHDGGVWGKNSKAWYNPTSGKKSINYISVPYEAGVHWATPNRNCETAILVEDILSATRVRQDTPWHSVALLGTKFNDNTVKSLMQKGIKHVVVALDPDALSKAVWIVNKYRVFFNTFKVLSLSKDPKDLSEEEFNEEVVSNIQ